MSRETDFFSAVASRVVVRVRVAAIVIVADKLLVQRPTDDPNACFALIGGEYELGDTFEGRLRREFEEETTARVVRAEYRFVVENFFRAGGQTLQCLEHYFEVELDRQEISSKEPHLSQNWLPLGSLCEYDLRPRIVRDSIASGRYREARHLVEHLATP